MKKNRKKRLLAILLTLVIAISFIPQNNVKAEQIHEEGIVDTDLSEEDIIDTDLEIETDTNDESTDANGESTDIDGESTDIDDESTDIDDESTDTNDGSYILPDEIIGSNLGLETANEVYSLDFATDGIDRANNRITYNVDGSDIVIEIEDTQSDSFEWDNGTLKIAVDKLDAVKFNILDYDNVRDNIIVKVDDTSLDNIPGDGGFYLSGILDSFSGGNNPVLSVESNGGGGNDPSQPVGNRTAVINLSGPAGEWQVDPKVKENYDYTSDEYSSTSYSKYVYVTGISINGGQSTNHLNQYSKDADLSGYQTQNITYDREDDEDTVDFNFYSNWANRIESVTINGQPYDITLNYDNRNEWLNAFNIQDIGFTITGVPVGAVNPEGEEVYDVEVQVRPITEEECFIGNFLWNNDDNPYDDQCIGHSRLSLISVTYNDGTGEYTKSIDELKNSDGNNIYPFIQVDVHTEEETGIECGSMVIPEGAWVTMKIEPEYGYQVKSFNLTGEDIKLGDTSVFSFRVGKGNFHIGAHVEEQEDDVKIDADIISNAAVELADGTLETGSARLSISEPEISSEKKEEFDNQAAKSGYEIESYLDIGLNQVFYQGTGNSDDVWAIPMEDLEDSATIYLQLEEGVSINDIEIIHNIHNGKDFEVLDVEVFDEEARVIKVKVNSFSNFAIAKKVKAADITPSTISANTNSPKTGDPITDMVFTMMIVSGGLLLSMGKKKSLVDAINRLKNK